MRGLRPFALAGIAAFAAPAAADVVRLRNGDILEGKAKDLGESVQVTTPTSTVEMPWSAVQVIDREGTAASDLAARRAQVKDGDAKGLLSLALWCRRQGLAAEAKELAGKVVALETDNAAAREILGEQKCCAGAAGEGWKGGDDLMAAKGFVRRDGTWLLKVEAEALDRRAAREKEASEEEKRAARLLESLGDRSPSVRTYAAEALASVDPALRHRLYLVGLRHKSPAVRAASATGLGVKDDESAVRSLLQLAVKDGDADVRAAAAQALHVVALPEIARPLSRALWSESPAVRMNAAAALGVFGSKATVETLIRRVQWVAGPSNRANIQVLNQISYISDYDVEIAQLSQIGDPIIQQLREGVILDCKVLGARGEDVEIERRAYQKALVLLTGRDYGTDGAAWQKWWDAEGKKEYAAKD